MYPYMYMEVGGCECTPSYSHMYMEVCVSGCGYCHSSSSYEEAARCLETYKAYENKPPDLIMERMDSDFSSRV